MFKPSSCIDSIISSASFLRSNPVSIKTHFDCLPIALCNNVPTTAESTPPLIAVITSLSPTCSLIELIVSSTIYFEIQSLSHCAILNKKFLNTSFPISECTTSG